MLYFKIQYTDTDTQRTQTQLCISHCVNFNSDYEAYAIIYRFNVAVYIFSGIKPNQVSLMHISMFFPTVKMKVK